MDDLAETVATYEAVADEYADRHDDREPVRAYLETFLEALDGEVVLDVGCGPGWETAALAEHGYRVLAVDLAPRFLAMTAERAPDAGVARMDMRELGLRDDAADGLWACASFLHVPREEAPATLAEFRRVLRPGGVALLSVKRGDGEGAGAAYAEDVRRFTYYGVDELRGLLADAGFDVERVRVVGDGWIEAVARA